MFGNKNTVKLIFGIPAFSSELLWTASYTSGDMLMCHSGKLQGHRTVRSRDQKPEKNLQVHKVKLRTGV